MEHRIEPALLPGYLVHEADGHETIGLYDDHTAADTLIEQLADAAGIDLEQAGAALQWRKGSVPRIIAFWRLVSLFLSERC